MKMTPVVSSNIGSIGYDPAAQLLRVAFKNGSVHDRPDTSPEEYAAFMAADSHGRHFHQHFRGGTVRAPQQDEGPAASEVLYDGPPVGGAMGSAPAPASLDAAIERFSKGSE